MRIGCLYNKFFNFMKSSDYEDADHHTRSSAMIPHRKIDMRSFFSTMKKKHHIKQISCSRLQRRKNEDYRDERPLYEIVNDDDSDSD